MNKILSIVAVIIVTLAGLLVWREVTRAREIREAVGHANAVADTFAAVIDVQAGTIEERGRQLVDGEAALKRLAMLNAELAAELGDAGVTVLGHTRTIGVLRDSVRRLGTRPDTLVAGLLRYPIHWRVGVDPDNWYGVTGALFAQPAGASWFDLDLEVGFSLDVTVSRTPDLALRCDAVTGLPGVARLTSLRCFDQLDDPIGIPPQSFGLRMFEPPALVTGTLTGVLGLLIGLAASR